jgi:AcrR family transcriptional regulator
MEKDAIMKEQRKKNNIIDAAEYVMSKKGFAASTISEIAKKAEVNEYIIYQFFKGKEDLCFAIPQRKMIEVLKLLDDHLQGIRDVESRLSKFIWFQLSYNDNNPDYARILLSDCRSLENFYSSNAYKLIKQYARELTLILKQGVSEGKIRNDISLRLIRDVIFGMLDLENISCFSMEEIDNSLDDFEHMLSLIDHMIKPKKNVDVQQMKSEKILEAGAKLIATKGYSSTKMSEIAKLAGVAEGTVYDYFENKEDLLLSIPKKFFEQYDLALDELFRIKNSGRKLKRLIHYSFTYLLRDRESLKIYLLYIQQNKLFYSSTMYKDLKKYYTLIEDIIKEGISNGVFRQDINPRVFRNMFFGAFSHIALRWLLFDDKTDKFIEIDQLITLLSAAVSRDN